MKQAPYAGDCNPHYQRNAQFVKFGDFSKKLLLWFNPDKNIGFFVTQPDGHNFNGGICLAKSFVDERAYASK